MRIPLDESLCGSSVFVAAGQPTWELRIGCQGPGSKDCSSAIAQSCTTKMTGLLRLESWRTLATSHTPMTDWLVTLLVPTPKSSWRPEQVSCWHPPSWPQQYGGPPANPRIPVCTHTVVAVPVPPSRPGTGSPPSVSPACQGHQGNHPRPAPTCCTVQYSNIQHHGQH
jgi:hypothetical protein